VSVSVGFPLKQKGLAMLIAVSIAFTLALGDPKDDRKPSKDCFLVESFTRDLTAVGYTVVSTDRDVAVRYLSTLVNLGLPKPPVKLSKLEGLVLVTTPEAPQSVLVGLVTDAGQLCYAINIPRNIHDAILRGA
jgi:hypothetical protein